MALTLQDIEDLLHRRGHEMYSGEPVTQLEHALQSAALAEAEGADDALVTAALLHDLGHLLQDLGETPTLRGIDDLHQYAALPFLRGLFPDAVLDGIRLHVDAKRWLCATRPGYFDALSADSQRSLALQGGVFDAAQAADFIAQDGAAAAVRLRLWDDGAKTAGAPTPGLQHFLGRARRIALR
jgi:phosphonate degradation associated HDIG domain protein